MSSPGKVVVVATFSMPLEAEMARGQLEAEGIPARVADEDTVTLFNLGGAFGTVKLMVSEEHLERARAILDELPEPISVPAPTDIEAEESVAGWICAQCDTEVSVDQTRCPSCAAPRPGMVRPIPTKAVGSEDDYDPVSPTDVMATHALRAAVFGMVICPPLLQIYSLYLVFQLYTSSDELSPSAARKTTWAFVLDCLYIILVLLAYRFLFR